MTWAAVGSAGIGLVGGVMGSNAAGGSAREERRRNKRAYNAMINRSANMADSGEQQFMSETAAPLDELEGARQSALTGQSEALQQGAGQMMANLAQQGVRGGQAATLLNRGTGQMSVDANRDINQMAIQEAEQRRKLRTGLMGQKATTGYGGQIQ